ncbi:hypothetical protein ACYULU_12560 [Breznakiellaceae bacterium SP9]
MAEEQAEQTEERISWHPAFVQALELELEQYQDILEFRQELQLNKEPLRIDVLIIKKLRDVVLEKNIAHIFRGYNIVEFKSPSVYVAVKDFYKVYGYAALYVALHPEALITDMTISIVETKHPRELLKHFRDVRGYKVVETERGIYEVRGDIVPIQIIESKKLSASNNLWLRSLNKGLDRDGAGAVLKESERKMRTMQLGAYLQVILKANPEIMKEVFKMSEGKQTLEDVLMEVGLIQEWMEKGKLEGKLEGARNMLKRHFPLEVIADITELPIDTITAL